MFNDPSTTFWFVFGFVLFVIEILTPGVVMVFFGLGAWIVLVLIMFFPLNSWMQWVIFSISSVLMLVLLRKHITQLFRSKEAIKSDSLSEPMVADRYLGRDAMALEDIEPGKIGMVEFDGTNWNARSQNLILAKNQCRIIEVDGLTLWVEPWS